MPKPLKGPSLARSVPKPLKGPSLARSVPKPLKVPSLARSVPKPLKVPSLARSVPKPLKVGQEGEGRGRQCCSYVGSWGLYSVGGLWLQRVTEPRFWSAPKIPEHRNRNKLNNSLTV